MAEIWAAAAVSIVGGVMAGKAAEKKDKSDKAHDAAMSEDESRYAAQRTAHERALEDFYTQKQRARTQRGLDQYRAFHTMGSVNPAYDVSTEARIDPGTAPKYSDFDEAPPEEAAGPRKKGKSLSDIHKKLRDPLGIF